jgi:hypothetical protein
MEVAGANRRWPSQFRYRGSRRESAVAQLSTLDEKSISLHLLAGLAIAGIGRGTAHML